ncbi:hypothetical protein ACEQ8H_003833 [Pleosporales sp. CAS-2024a]
MASSGGLPITAAAAKYIIRHVVLPPKLPQESDYKAEHEKCLIDSVILALQDLQDVAHNQDVKDVVASAITTIRNLDSGRDKDGNISESQLCTVLQKIATAKCDEQMALEVKAQNAGLLISLRGDHVSFEPFELAPTNQVVMSTVGRLVRTFPGSRSRVPISVLQDADFRNSLAYTIAKMSTQTASGMQPRVQKMGRDHDEDRDTANPAMISDWFVNYIAALGQLAQTICITKNTREEVLWNNSRFPWRRSPLWLLIRVTLQLHFMRTSSLNAPLDGLYKVFMVQLLSRILQSAKEKWKVIGSENVHVICAKMERRLRKLEHLGQMSLLSPHWVEQLQENMVEAHSFINSNWTALANSHSSNIDTFTLRNIQPDQALDTLLPELDTFLTSIHARERDTKCAEFLPQGNYPLYPSDELPKTLSVTHASKCSHLFALEAWVENNLNSWLSHHIRDVGSCGALFDLIQRYHTIASTEYKDVPVSMSIMYLTLLELWIACDKVACSLYPLLSEYDPELVLMELQCLILPLKSQMERLHGVEQYIEHRRKVAVKGNPSVFEHFGSPSTFAVRYFDQSSLPAIKLAIEQDATAQQKRKREELAGLKSQHKKLMTQYNSTVCDQETYVYDRFHGYTSTRHSRFCQRCASKTKAESLRIDIYEWPLSPCEQKAKATVFELQIPQDFSDWRDASMFLATTVLGCAMDNSKRPQFQYTLDRHRGLSNRLSSKYSARRIIILSSVKSHTDTHRKELGAVQNLKERDVCLSNALQYAYYDKSLELHTFPRKSKGKLVQECMYRMPDARSKSLEYFLSKPPSDPDGRTPNEVIASLADCPAHFSLDEYKAFGAIPLGRNIIYANVLTQLAAPSIDLAKAEAQTLLLQVIGQCGTPNGLLRRTSHSVLSDDSLCNALLEQIELSLHRVSENWESWRTVATLVALCSRILSLTISSSVSNRCLDCLAQARSISMDWLLRLQSRARDSVEEKQRTDLFSRATEIALLCSQTFNVEDEYLDVVFQGPSALSMLLQCSIVIQENHKTTISESKAIYKTMLHSWMTFLYRAFTNIRRAILQGDPGLDAAVSANWASFQPRIGSHWKILRHIHEHWLYTESGGLKVYFNLLSAELLVNGLPLSRLPSEYMEHDMYTPLFGRSTLEVVPTDWPGMKFSAKALYQDRKLYFGMVGADMLVAAVKDESTWDLVPSRVFRNRLPAAFVRDYIHWYDHSQEMVILSPINEPWSTSSDGWRLIRAGAAWRVVKDDCVLASISSYTASTLCATFDALENRQHIHIVLNILTRAILIHLPRLQIDFHIEAHDHRIYSRQYRGMIVDQDQTVGALVGLTSKMVLTPATTGGDRVVLVPAPRSFDTDSVRCVAVLNDHHVMVSIDQESAHKVFAYSLDTTLGRVQESGDMQRRLFLAFLHALTSHCLPDPLTGYTGTEAALKILKSAAARSFEYLTTEDVQLLHQIASLSPFRTFYPSHLTEMQQVDWDPRLPFLSQHPELRVCANDIVKQAETMRLYYPDQMPDTAHWKSSNSHLEKRNSIRISTFQVDGFGAELYSSNEDVIYKSRDQYPQSQRGQRAYIAAMLIARNHTHLHSAIEDLKVSVLSSHFQGKDVQGPNDSFDPAILHYDSEWLLKPTPIFQKYWCDLHRALPDLADRCNKYHIMAWLATMAFAESADMRPLQAFAAFYRLRASGSVKPPSAPIFHLVNGSTLVASEIETIIMNAAKTFDDSTEARMPKKASETEWDHHNRLKNLFETRKDAVVQDLVAELQRQWPTNRPTIRSSATVLKYVDIQDAIPRIKAKFKTWYDNRQFLQYLQDTSTLMAQQRELSITCPRPPSGVPSIPNNTSGSRRMLLIANVFKTAPLAISHGTEMLVPPCEPKIPLDLDLGLSQHNAKHSRLDQLCTALQSLAKSECERSYIVTLQDSCASLSALHANKAEVPEVLSSANLQDLLKTYVNDCQHYLDSFNRALVQVVANNGSLSDRIGLLVQHSPRLSPTFWLAQLHRDRFCELPESWKVVIVEFGLAITQLHRAQRLMALSHKPVDLMEELSHVGHTNWDPQDRPETLLLEAESGILIRREQEFIASKMRDPDKSTNIVLQLLMGGGKSSTIVPMLATELTDKEKLVRILVAKPQRNQMAQILISKLGYLLNRRVYHMPFSRSLQPSVAETTIIRQTFEECILNRGILLIQPEHILSFKLMAIEALSVGQACARTLLDTQSFFNSVSRDIVDESDENFSAKFELIYTMGSQRSIDFAPQRWLIIQAIIGLIPRFARQVKDESQGSMEIERDEAGRFPRVRILRKDGADELILRLARHVVEFGIAGLPSSSQSPEVQAALLRYITEPELTSSEIATVEENRFWTESTKSPLLIIRGLLAGGIVKFALGTKRWRVNYGLDPTRVPETQLAVPFRSKDCPSPRSEFSHPDVVILLTLLSHYYGGLTDEQLFDSFTHLLKSDQGGIQYDEWASTASPGLPSAFRQLSGVSIKDSHQCIVNLFPFLRYSKKAIDYYLSFLVFPKAMKEFPQKLSASGWDIGAVKTHPVTGFSGTNDTLHLLPLAVKHLELPSQSHTNALVLQYLLQEETSVELLPPRTETGRSDAEHLLSLVTQLKPEVRVILDCGASILEQNNQQVAKAWLEKRVDSCIQAVVYFEGEELSVLDRAGRIEPLQTSPFAKDLGGLVKDKLTQGCMRMRKLGVGQSVAFIVPEEISFKIRERTGKPVNSSIDVSYVLCWSITETWQDLKRMMPLWAVQGERFERNKGLLRGVQTTKEQADAFLEDEAQSIETRYLPLAQGEDTLGMLKTWDLNNPNIAKIVMRCQEFEAMGFGAATLSEEQERELAPEIEEEKQIERPARLKPADHKIHRHVGHLVRTGQLIADSDGFCPAFQALSNTSAGKLFALDQFPTDLLVTADFVRTVEASGSSGRAFVSDSYQRPVQFLLSVRQAASDKVEHLIIISPFEANSLIKSIRKDNKLTLHLFAPRTNASFDSLDRLQLYNTGRAFSPDDIPPSLTVQLNLFTGSLYLRSYAEYTQLCDFLGLLRSRPTKDQQVDADGFIHPAAGKWRLRKSPVPFLTTLLMKIRREGEGVEKTHLGRILGGIRLEEADFGADVAPSGS